MRKALTIVLLGLSLSLSACGKDVDKVAEETSSLLGKKESPEVQENNQDGFSYSTEPSLNNLKIDLTTPEGVAIAYYAWANYGDGENACGLIANKYLQSIGGKEECIKSIKQYASSMRIAFPDNLDLSEAIKATPTTKGNYSRVVLILTLPTGEFYTETLNLELINEKWLISSRVDTVSRPSA